MSEDIVNYFVNSLVGELRNFDQFLLLRTYGLAYAVHMQFGTLVLNSDMS